MIYLTSKVIRYPYLNELITVYKATNDIAHVLGISTKTLEYKVKGKENEDFLLSELILIANFFMLTNDEIHYYFQSSQKSRKIMVDKVTM